MTKEETQLASSTNGAAPRLAAEKVLDRDGWRLLLPQRAFRLLCWHRPGLFARIPQQEGSPASQISRSTRMPDAQETPLYRENGHRRANLARSRSDRQSSHPTQEHADTAAAPGPNCRILLGAPPHLHSRCSLV